ncbi:hypothetical protein CPB83DRAFT_763235 [Crepidotus variabilis]|uniref:Uncharacterized protein n=1 Tax=Crepidotus variabilis TaxID=179855 RepID=A0A9P6JRX4_9AGAR|nr:hypothetical protein CPB83DRAFT_763235 [Crepidotus variabilis]
MPGSSSELEIEIDPTFGQLDDSPDDPLPEWCPQIILEILELLHSVVSSAQPTSSLDPFIERFKYNVISSSLLAPSLPAPHPKRSSKPLSIPGRLNHSRESSVAENVPPPPPSTSTPDQSSGLATLAGGSAAVFLSLGYPLFTLLSLSATLYLLYNSIYTTDTPKHDMTASVNALEDLVEANSLWESVVQDSVTFLEDEERSSLQSSSGSSVSSPIRVALHSCLQSTHSQCDNIRHLFSALTSPSELSQLAEMYAPPSPIKTAFSTEMSARPFSYPSAYLKSPTDASHAPTTPENKRATWNGSYSSLAEAGSPTNSVNRRRERQHANLSDVFQLTSPVNVASAPVSPMAHRLSDVQEGEEVKTAPIGNVTTQPSHFGAAALDLQRKRRSGAVDLLRSPPTTQLTMDMRSPRARSGTFMSTISSSSKYTNPQPSRHPLSFAALTFSLQGAVAAKRYASSHLLALRFSDEEDEGYWEDVRSVMALLTTTLVDAASRLSEALEDLEHQKFLDSSPTPVHSQSRFSEADLESDLLFHQDQQDERSQAASKRQSILVDDKHWSFAPMPSHISRFAAHIAAISSALDDAREHLDQCVSSLKQDREPEPLSSTQRKLRHSRSFSRLGAEQEEEPEESKALQAYERLRRELGLALRECERGREKLLEIVHPSIPSDDEDDDELPGLGQYASDESDKVDPTSPQSEPEEGEVGSREPTLVMNSNDAAHINDDATSHLLLSTTANHLPLPGIEEVFEAETGPKLTALRERSKLSREDRIKLAKAKRESGKGLGFQSALPDVGEEKMEAEKWGPGGDVVQELKDVIWKVGEKRRRMSEEVVSKQDRKPNRDSELPYLAEDLEFESSNQQKSQLPYVDTMESS